MLTPDDVLCFDNLRKAWERVRGNRGAAGVDRVRIGDIADNIELVLAQLRHRVIEGDYTPQPLMVVRIPKDDGSERLLAVPTVHDRILQTAVALPLGERLDPMFSEASFGYRPGRGVRNAVDKVSYLRSLGYEWVVDADIERFFERVSHTRVLSILKPWMHQDLIDTLVAPWLVTPLQEDEQFWKPVRGLPMGSPLSPLLSNLYLHEFDAAILDAEQKLVRYADDFLILCRSRKSADNALRLVDRELEDIELAVNRRKTRIVHFDEGFDFLGYCFVRSLRVQHAPDGDDITPARAAVKREPDWAIKVPSQARAVAGPVEAAPDSTSPETAASEPVIDDMADWFENPADVPVYSGTLYLQQQGVNVSLFSNRFEIRKGGELLSSIPVFQVSQILIFGRINITQPFLLFCLREQIPVVFCSQNGLYRGSLLTRYAYDATLQTAQVMARLDDQWRHQQCAHWLVAKIRNQLVTLKRFVADRDPQLFDSTTRGLNALMRLVPHAGDTTRLMGYEGAAARIYFLAFSRLLAKNDVSFDKRTRHPAKDPVSAMLALGYNVLHDNVLSMLVLERLNPAIGVLHADKLGHAALASDVMEPFRSAIVDRVVWTICLNDGLDPADTPIDPVSGVCRMTDDFRRRFLRKLDQKFSSTISDPASGQTMSYRRRIQLDIRRLKQSLMERQARLKSFELR